MQLPRQKQGSWKGVPCKRSSLLRIMCLPSHRSNEAMGRMISCRGLDPSSMPPPCGVLHEPPPSSVRPRVILGSAWFPCRVLFIAATETPPPVLRNAPQLDSCAMASFPACRQYLHLLQPESPLADPGQPPAKSGRPGSSTKCGTDRGRGSRRNWEGERVKGKSRVQEGDVGGWSSIYVRMSRRAERAANHATVLIRYSLYNHSSSLKAE